MRWIRVAPVTAESIIFGAVIFLSCHLQSRLNGESFESVQRQWGAIRTLQAIDSPRVWNRGPVITANRGAYGASSSLDDEHPEPRRADMVLQPSGPLDVWDGEWWRIPMTVFHHHSLMHLLLCVYAVWYLGTRLESYCGSMACGLFLIPAGCIPVMAELVCGNSFMGLSGVACAMFGALLVQQNSSNRLGVLLTDDAVEFGALALGLCWLSAIASTGVSAYAAHLVGFIYGGAIGMLTSDQLGKGIWLRVVVTIAHWMMLPGALVASHPVWSGRYQWYRSQTATDPHMSEIYLNRALRRDPNLVGAWLQWSYVAQTDGELVVAWERMINGLYYNPSSIPAIEATQRLWQHLNPAQRHDAIQTLEQYFGTRAKLWLNQIRLNSSSSNQESDESVNNFFYLEDLSSFRLDQKIELPTFDLPSAQSLHKVPLVPSNRNDAMEGESL